MPLDISEIRAAFAHHLQQHAASRYSLDAALMHVVERAYQQGHNDAVNVPDVINNSIVKFVDFDDSDNYGE